MVFDLFGVNYLAVLVAAIAAMASGFLWYGSLFGKAWISLMGFTPQQMEEAKKKGMGKTYAISLLATLVTACVLAHLNDAIVADTVLKALDVALWVWAGFVAATMINSVLWEGRPWKLYFLNAAHQLVSVFVMAVILAIWK